MRDSLAATPGVQVHAETPDGRLVVTVEDAGQGDPADTIIELHRLDGVLSAVMVYHYFEPDPSDQEMPDEVEQA